MLVQLFVARLSYSGKLVARVFSQKFRARSRRIFVRIEE
jgi:hypothetical protein